MLIVDDDERMRTMFSRSLGRAGFDVIVADDALVGLRRLREDPAIRLVLLDLNMPGVDGWQFRKEQRSNPEMRDVPTVIVTGAPLSEVCSVELHASEYLLKPVGHDHLVRVVSDYCEPAARW